MEKINVKKVDAGQLKEGLVFQLEEGSIEDLIKKFEKNHVIVIGRLPDNVFIINKFFKVVDL